MDRKTFEVTHDGTRVWVNIGARCAGRFGKHGWEVHTFSKGFESRTGGKQNVPNTEQDWKDFVASVKDVHDVEVSSAFMPATLQSFSSLLDTALGPVKKTRPANDLHQWQVQNLFDEIRSTIASNPESSSASLKNLLEELIGPIDESGTRIAGNELTFISAAPNEDGFYITLTVTY